jgi:hypothetical protein
MRRSDPPARAPRYAQARALGWALALALFGVAVLLAAPDAARGARPDRTAWRADPPHVPASDWLVERASLETEAIGLERAVDGARTRRPDGAGSVLLQNALGLELPGARALVRTRTCVRQPRRLDRPCVSARAPPVC